MNLNESPSKEQLIEIMSKCDDRAGNHQVLVYKDGRVDIILQPVGGDKKTFYRDAKFYLETFGRGNNHTGVEAAKNQYLVDRIFKAIVDNWDKNASGLIEHF